VVVLAAAAGLLPLINAGGSTGSSKAATGSKAPKTVLVGTAVVHDLGVALVDSAGRPLYMFAPDERTHVSCNAVCQKIWPPLTAPRRGSARAVGAARQALIGSAPNPVAHDRIVTYDGWPLYTYVLDKAPRVANGQNVVLNGGYWWVLRPNGQVNRKPVPHSTAIVGS